MSLLEVNFQTRSRAGIKTFSCFFRVHQRPCASCEVTGNGHITGCRVQQDQDIAGVELESQSLQLSNPLACTIIFVASRPLIALTVTGCLLPAARNPLVDVWLWACLRDHVLVEADSPCLPAFGPIHP